MTSWDMFLTSWFRDKATKKHWSLIWISCLQITKENVTFLCLVPAGLNTPTVERHRLWRHATSTSARATASRRNLEGHRGSSEGTPTCENIPTTAKTVYRHQTNNIKCVNLVLVENDTWRDSTDIFYWLWPRCLGNINNTGYSLDQM